MESGSHRLFLKVAEQLGWTGNGGLERAEEKLIKSIGKSRRHAVGVQDAKLQLSDSDGSGKENCLGKAAQPKKRVGLESSDDDFDLFLVEKATPKPANRRPVCPPEKISPPVLLESSDSEGSFEKFLGRMKTPKAKPATAVGRGSGDSLRHFIVNSCSSDEDFAPEKITMTTTKKKSGKSNSKSLDTPQPPVRRPPAQWESPVFLSDSSEDEGVVIRSTWRTRHAPRGPRSIGQEPTPDGPPSPPRSKPAHRAPPQLDGSSSDEEFQSLLERLKKNHNPTQTPPRNPEPKQKACTSMPPMRGRGEANPLRAEKGAQVDRIPVQPAVCRPAVSQTEPRPSGASRRAICKTPGCFLLSLSAAGSPYCRSFKQHKEELTGRLYKLYNSSVFEDKLPAGMSVSWNKKMRKTAGYCVTGQERGGGNRYARIELSEKVCDSADRLRDTLVHEMCHAATWLINGVRDGHGAFWKLYAQKATLAHPELPMVTRCHSYDINYKYKYQCSRCKNTIGRHSKSLDTQRFACALCTGQLVLLTSGNARGATPFASFVKENYGTARQELGGKSHADVMRKLSADFAKTRLSQS